MAKANGMQVSDAGHIFELASLDGNYPQSLRFVKRVDHNNPNKYPGNTSGYPGTTLQMVLRALLSRARYLQGQHWCIENALIISCLMCSIWLLEFRAARRHGFFYCHGLSFASGAEICDQCGHTVCKDDH